MTEGTHTACIVPATWLVGNLFLCLRGRRLAAVAFFRYSNVMEKALLVSLLACSHQAMG